MVDYCCSSPVPSVKNLPRSKSAFAPDGPAIIDVLTDPIELVMPPKVTVEQAKGFSVWMMKAVLNGQGNELVELARSAWAR
jgi:pyruvate dehydrogenase (quinone)